MATAAAAPYERVAEDMAKGQEYATQLQALLRGSSSTSPEAGRLVDQILHAMSRTIHTAKAAAAAAAEEEEASEVRSDVTCTGGGGKRKAASAAAGGGGGKNKAACRRRSRTHQSSSVVAKSAKDLEDGHAWRKYGQKEIQNCKHPKAYFRCTHKFDQQCAAQRQVQRLDDDPDLYTVTYIGVHTCRDPATAAVAPLVVHVAGAADDLHHAGSRLISFGATTTTTSTQQQQQQQAEHKDAAAQQLMALPPKLECGGGAEQQEQEEVLSSLTPAGSTEATRNASAAAAATPGPDQGDVTSGLLQQQHCCYGAGGDHLAATMAAHFGYDDDDTFDWTAFCSDSIADIYPDY